MGTRTRSEWVQNEYRMDIKQLQKGNRSQKGKKHSLECKLYEKAFFRTHACKIRYQSAYQGFKNDTISNTNSSNFFLAQQSWENDGTNHLMSFFISF